MVRMLHDDPVATAGPTTADVPEAGIPMMERAGWYVAPEQPEGGDPDNQGAGENPDGDNSHSESPAPRKPQKAEK